MLKTKIAFFGTQEFAATILEGLISDKNISIEMVFTQPDRKVGRKQVLEESPVKKLALKNNLKVSQPESLKNYQLPSSDFDLAVVAQYGLIIPQNIIESFPRGMINVHGSVLPKYRGASPIQYALVNGESSTGITIMLMDDKVDHGPVLSQESLAITPDDTYSTLSQKMAKIGSKLLLDTIHKYIERGVNPQTQVHEEATFTKLISKDDGRIDFSKSANDIYNLYRGFTPWPGVWCVWKEKRLKLLKIIPSDKTLSPGEVLLENKHIFIGCGGNSIEVLELQLEGKSAMSAEVFANGYKNINGEKLS